MRIEVLGPARLVVDGVERPFPAGRPGLALQLLLRRPGAVVPVDELVTTLWPDVAPDVSAKRLWVALTRLRRLLESAIRIVAAGEGYRLEASASAIDRLEFEELAERAEAGDPAAAERALELWRGDPYLGFVSAPGLVHERRQLMARAARLRPAAAVTATEPAAAGAQGPPPVGSARSRPRLLDALPAVGSGHVATVVAPAGYGKTTLLAQWAARADAPVAWLTADEQCNDSPTFWSRLARGCRVVAPDVSDAHDGRWTPARLVNELADRRLGIAVDRFEVVTAPDVHAQLDVFLRRRPPGLTVAVASRRSVPVRTGRLRAVGAIVRLRAVDLAFTSAELNEVLETRRALTDSDPRTRAQRAALRAHAAGWPAATVLLARSLAEGESVDDAVAAVERAIVEPLLEDLPGELVELLVETSHVELLSPSLCDAITGRADAAASIDVLVNEHQLLVPEGSFHVVHPMVRAVLARTRKARGKDRIRRGDAAAARWYLERRRADQALPHAARAQDERLLRSALSPALTLIATRANSRLLRACAAGPPLPKADSLSSDCITTAVLLGAFLPVELRGRWVPRSYLVHSGAAALATEAVDRWREFDCAGALSAVRRARAELEADPARPPADAVRALLDAVDDAAQLLARGTRAAVHHDAASPWPWLVMWVFGQRALVAYLMGDVSAASVLLDHARARCGAVDRTWGDLSDGSALVVEALLAADGAETIAQRRRAARALDDVVGLVDAGAGGPMAIVARYAAHLAHRRAGDGDAAAACREQADELAAGREDLVLLREIRARLCHDPALDVLEALDALSPREREVLGHLDSELTLAQIARRLFISEHTVRAHARSIYRKLRISRRSEVARYARYL